MAASFYQPLIVLEALVLTAAVVLGLTAYAFWGVAGPDQAGGPAAG